MSGPLSPAGARRRIGVGFTTRASCLLAAGVTALGSGILLGETDLTRAGALAVAAPLLAALFVHRSRLTISAGRSVEPARAPGGTRVTVRLTLANRSALPAGALMLEDGLPGPVSGRARFALDGLAGREERTVAYALPPLPRGRYRSGPLLVRTIDPFGLVDWTRSSTAISDFLVTPRVEPLAGLPPVSFDLGENVGSHSVGARGADDASTREYRTGDDLRKIHWRSTARTGSLMVRQEERRWQGSTTLVADLRAAGHICPTRLGAGPGTHAGHTDGTGSPGGDDERQADTLEWAISAVASIGSALLAGGRDLTVVDGTSIPGRPGGSVRFGTANALVDHLSEVRASGSADLSGIRADLRDAGRDSTVVAVLGALDPASVRTLVEARPRRSSAPAFAILIDTQSWVSQTLAIGAAATQSHWQRTSEQLQAAGWHVVAARRGDSVAEVWSRLLASARTTRLSSWVEGARR